MKARRPFQYVAARPDGELESGTVDALDREHAASELALKGLFPVNLAKQRVPQLGVRPSANDTALGLRLLADLLNAGLTLKRALVILEDIAPASWNKAVPVLRESIRRGEHVGDAFAEAGLHLDPMIMGMIRAGDAAGEFASALERAATFAEERSASRNALKSALVYPIVLATAGTFALVFLLGSVLPRFASLLADTGRSLPPLTARLVWLSDFVQAQALTGLVGLTVLAVMIVFWRRSDAGRRTWDASLLRVPWVGSLLHAHCTSHSAQSIGSMLATGMTLPDAMSVTTASLNNLELVTRFGRASASIQEGQRIAASMAEYQAITPTATQLVAAGEETGDLSAMFLHAARLEREKVKRQVDRVIRLVEPGIILVFGAVVALVAAALLQAMYGVRVS